MVATWVKVCFMMSLCLQNTFYTLLRRYSVGVLQEGFSASSVLLGGEVVKLCVSAFCISRELGLGGVLRRGKVMAVPAAVFWAQNLLSYVSLQRIDATAFTVCAQLKILSTAVAGVLMLGRHLSWRRWRALMLLCLAVINVAFYSMPYRQRSVDDPGDASQSQFDHVLGLAAVLLEVALSGFINVYFERVLKTLDEGVELSVWDRNFQLAVWSIGLYTPMAVWDSPGGYVFHAWSSRTVALCALGAAGGILVALVTKHLDAIMKTFAAAGAIVVTAIVGMLFMQQPRSVGVAVGCASAILALLNYLDQDEMKPERQHTPEPAPEDKDGKGRRTTSPAPGRTTDGLHGRQLSLSGGATPGTRLASVISGPPPRRLADEPASAV